MKRFAILRASNRFPLLGASATLAGCLDDSDGHIKRLLHNELWGTSGWDKGYDLRDDGGGGHGVDSAENFQAKLAEFVSSANAASGMAIIAPFASSHGTRYIDPVTGKTCFCMVHHYSTWDKPNSFTSALALQRILDKLKPDKRVYTLIDCCASGDAGNTFRMFETFTHRNRWIEPPPEIQKDLDDPVEVKMPKQCWTYNGCEKDGTCADVQGPRPHGLFSDTFDNTATPNLKKTALVAAMNAKMQGSQKSVLNGPEWAYLQES